MKTEFTAKYLQHLSKKNKDGGFTLIELLVVIIIVGVLAAIALPSFLNQIGKARGSEAKSNLGVINRAQQAYRLENGAMADNLTRLDARINSEGFYTYSVTGNNVDDATASAISVQQNDLRAYTAYVQQDAANNTFTTIICESNAIVAPAAIPATTADFVDTDGTCTANAQAIN